MLEIRDLRTYFQTEQGEVKAVDGVSLDLKPGGTLGIVGESGSGKSVTALSILKLLPFPPAIIKSGEILFEGEDLLRISEEKLRRVRGGKIGMIFQDPMTSLNPVYSIGMQISESLELHRPELDKLQRKKTVIEFLSEVGIPAPDRRYDDYPHQLSGGMRQRVMIAMALCCHPKLLIADEPTTALDVTIQNQILDLIKKLQKEHQMAMILITHDLGVVSEVVDEVAVMYAGQIVERARVSDLFEKPLHPYTRALMASLPNESTRPREHLNVIPGSVPNPIDLPKGCRFQDRCDLVQPHCREKDPELETHQSRSYRCFEVKP